MEAQMYTKHFIFARINYPGFKPRDDVSTLGMRCQDRVKDCWSWRRLERVKNLHKNYLS